MEKFLKLGETFSKRFIGKMKDKPQKMFPFNSSGECSPPLSWFSNSSFWYLAREGASRVGSYYSHISKYDDTLVKNWQTSISIDACKNI